MNMGDLTIINIPPRKNPIFFRRLLKISNSKKYQLKRHFPLENEKKNPRWQRNTEKECIKIFATPAAMLGRKATDLPEIAGLQV
jgi:hypothetical protein